MENLNCVRFVYSYLLSSYSVHSAGVCEIWHSNIFQNTTTHMDMGHIGESMNIRYKKKIKKKIAFMNSSCTGNVASD